MVYIGVLFLIIVTALQAATWDWVRSSFQYLRHATPTTDWDHFPPIAVRVVSGFMRAIFACFVMVLLGGVGEASLSRYTVDCLYVSVNVLAALVVCQSSATYHHKLIVLRVLMIVNWITLDTIDRHWWVLATSPSVNLLLGSNIVMTVATMGPRIGNGDGSHPMLNAILGAVLWTLSMQLQPLPFDRQDYIRSTLSVTIVTTQLQPAWLKLCAMLTWSFCCLMRVSGDAWNFKLPKVTPALPESTVMVIRKRAFENETQIGVGIGCAAFTALFGYYIYRKTRIENGRIAQNVLVLLERMEQGLMPSGPASQQPLSTRERGDREHVGEILTGEGAYAGNAPDGKGRPDEDIRLGHLFPGEDQVIEIPRGAYTRGSVGQDDLTISQASIPRVGERSNGIKLGRVVQQRDTAGRGGIESVPEGLHTTSASNNMI